MSVLDEGFDPTPAVGRQQRRARTAAALDALTLSNSAQSRQKLLEYVVRINLDVAHRVVTTCSNSASDTEDELRLTRAALTRAALDIHPDAHGEFLAYAVPRIRRELKRQFRDLGWTVRPATPT